MKLWVTLLDVPLDEGAGDEVALDLDGLLEGATADAPAGADDHGARGGPAVDDGVDAVGADVGQRQREGGLADGPAVRDLVHARPAVRRRPARHLPPRYQLRARRPDVRLVVLQPRHQRRLARPGWERRRYHRLGRHGNNK
ncbi:putative polyketide synthase protein [Rosellinia necatrix]|uniref:Putative polyketide synthase protein n=1 Tax=Rosellinia necatrix TaxID=77044 RepID=A0A1S8A699_ROSNE|nr:putative polyketide synthase protein [Rosellinia necatrix]